ncbi:Disease resistance protein [Acorus calamus]|uniref:Disease resistance protein n=1 Tax=Acorus calamus TaxID=4465 RepID=A0AAV9DBH5_ACOCL|nr:Disease resistance protein [Acorus calamus]
MELVGPVIEVAKCICNPVALYVGYVKNLKKNFIKLNEKASELYNMRDDVKLAITTNRAGMIPTAQCESWLKEVEDIEKKMDEMEENYKEAKSKCVKGLCPNVFSCMKFGKHVVVMIEDINDLMGTFAFDKGVLANAPMKAVEIVPAPRVRADSSTDRTVQKILDCIRDEHTQKIGIWGMGGVGKTTAMKILNNVPEISEMFAVVIWVTVSKDWTTRKVQNEIAQRLNITLPEDMSNDAVSRRLFEKLKNIRYLLLLDDVWDKVDLEDVGVPAPSLENGCKVLLTSRSRGICNKMETDLEIRVEVLSEEEAWELFHKKVGDVIDLSMIQPLARGIVEECGGLPLAIIVVGGALRKETDIHVWQNALNELSMAATSHIEDMEIVVFKRLKFSYDRLKDDNMRSCFVYGALYPEDYMIDVAELIEYWRAEGYIEGARNLKEARSKGRTILKDLVDVSLLERCYKEDQEKECVKMHDVIRDLALRITSHDGGEGQKFLARSGKGLEEPPEEQEEWECANGISLMHNKLAWLPEWVDCPALTTLFLQGNYELRTIPDLFLEGMPTLRVLDLSGTSIEQLPPSLCSLTSLRGLYLNDCRHLGSLPPEIGSLKSLEVLYLDKHSRIRNLPVEIGELGRLQHLRVSFYHNINDDMNHEVQRMIPYGGVSRLTRLQDLRIEVDNEDRRWDEIVEVVTEEIGALKELSCLDFCFASVEHLKRFIHISRPWNNGLLKSFCFIVSHPRGDFLSYISYELSQQKLPQLDQYMIFENGYTIPDVIVEVLKHAEGFILLKNKSFEKLEQLGVENLTRLKFFLIAMCDSVRTLIGGGCKLPNLEELRISMLSNILDIWDCNSSLMPPLLGNLRVLILEGCSKLKYVFPRGVLPHVPNLEVVDVSSCDKIQQIIEEEIKNSPLSKLKTLKLDGLYNLDCICEGVISWPSMELVSILACSKLKRLPFHNDNAPSLKTIQCHEAWWDSLEWEDDAIRNRYQSFFTPQKR